MINLKSEAVMEPFSRATLLLNVLNTIADQTGLKSSDLVFLNYEFTSQEISRLMDQLVESQIKRLPLTDQEFEKVITMVKPDLQGVPVVCQQLKTSFIAEERFLDVFS